MTELATNVLSYGDNLDSLRRYLPDAAVDLVYLDPPLNSNRDDNVIFRDESGNATAAQQNVLLGAAAAYGALSTELTTSVVTSTTRSYGKPARAVAWTTASRLEASKTDRQVSSSLTRIVQTWRTWACGMPIRAIAAWMSRAGIEGTYRSTR
jgi:hypothetical protein